MTNPIEIKLRDDGKLFYSAATKDDELLLSHVMGEPRSCIYKEQLKHAALIARAHGWEIKVVD